MKKMSRILAMVLALSMLLGSAEAATLTSAVINKVNELVSSLVTEETSAYKRAKVMHDWLINNANYDYTYTNYEPDGVLLKGTGVCQSYALA